MVNNICIKIKPSVLSGVLFLLDQDSIQSQAVARVDLRAMVSILVPLSRKLATTLATWSRRPNPTTKHYKLTFAYHEAYAVYAYIHAMRDQMHYGQERNACNIIHDILHQELS